MWGGQGRCNGAKDGIHRTATGPLGCVPVLQSPGTEGFAFKVQTEYLVDGERMKMLDLVKDPFRLWHWLFSSIAEYLPVFSATIEEVKLQLSIG